MILGVLGLPPFTVHKRRGEKKKLPSKLNTKLFSCQNLSVVSHISQSDDSETPILLSGEVWRKKKKIISFAPTGMERILITLLNYCIVFVVDRTSSVTYSPTIIKLFVTIKSCIVKGVYRGDIPSQIKIASSCLNVLYDGKS